MATGLALTIFGTGLSSLIGLSFVGRIVAPFGSIFPAALSRDPFWKVIFGYSPIVYFALIMVVAVWWFLRSTRSGADPPRGGRERSLGPFDRLFGDRRALCRDRLRRRHGRHRRAPYFSLVITPMWGRTDDRGGAAGSRWALVVFASWKAPRLLVGAYFFGFLMWLELYAKGGGLSGLPVIPSIPSQFWAAMPYLMTVVALTLISMRDRAGRQRACLPRASPFFPLTRNATNRRRPQWLF